MSKLILDDIASGYNLSKINSNFQKIEDEINDKVLYRENPIGEPNHMHQLLDMNSQKIINLAEGTAAADAVTLGQVRGFAINGIVPVDASDIPTTDGGGSVQDFIDTNTFKTVADMKAFTNHTVGSKVVWQGYYSQSDGGSNWGVVKSGAHVDDGGSIFSIDANTYIEANLKGGFKISLLKFGGKGDGAADLTSRQANSNAANNLIDYLVSSGQVKMYIPKGTSGSGLWTFQDTIVIGKGIKVCGDGMSETVLNFPAGVDGIRIFGDCGLRDIGFEMVEDNNSTAIGVKVVGDTVNRPFNVFISRVRCTNFSTAVETNWMWDSVIKSVHSANTLKGVKANGLSVNNTLKTCHLNGRAISDNNAGIQIGDGVTATEGWQITNNVTFAFGIGLRLVGCSFCPCNGNIWDFCYQFGILLSGISLNNKFVNEYVGMSNGSDTGAYFNNSADDPQSKGNKISQSEIVAYGSLNYGIILSQFEHNARIIDVSVDSVAVSSISVEGSPRNVRIIGCNFESDNAKFGNNGSNRDSLVYWSGNYGGITSSYVAIKFDYGLSVARYVEDTPSFGDYEVGDIAINRGAAQPNIYLWECTVAGVAGAGAQFKIVSMS